MPRPGIKQQQLDQHHQAEENIDLGRVADEVVVNAQQKDQQGAADFISEKSDQELLQEIETFDTDKAEMIYLYIPEDTGAGMSFAITREDHPEEMDEILSTIYGEKISCQKPKQVFNMTERILYDYNWYVLIYDHEMNQMALVFLYSDDVIVYNGHVLQTTETYDESIRPCILKLKEENQEKLKSGEATQRRVAIP